MTLPGHPAGTPFTDVLAVRYATLNSRKSALYYRWSEYGEPDGDATMDYYFWVLLRDEETVVVDTGFNPAVGERRGRTVLCSTADAFERLGIEPAAVTQLIITHLHYDHIGNLGLFPNAQLYVDAQELRFWAGPFADRPCFAGSTEKQELEQIAQLRAAGRVTAVGTAEEVIPGVMAVRAGGHSPGQQILRVATTAGDVIIGSDAAHFYEELALDRPFDVLADLQDAYAALATLRELQAAGLPIAVGHDPEVMIRFSQSSPALAGLAVSLVKTS